MDKSSEAYLESLSEAGIHDSTGSFTLSLKAALKKLGAFQLPRASAWVLKVVQSAVAWGAEEIAIKQRRYVTSFVFSGPAVFDLEALHVALLDPTPVGRTPALHLAAGLRAIGFSEKHRFSVKVCWKEKRQTLSWDGESLEVGEAVLELAEGCLVEVSVDFSTNEKGVSKVSARRASEEAAELVRASVCPVSLKLDGREMSTMTSPVPYRGNAKEARMALAWSGPPDDGRPALRLPPGVDLKEPWFRMTNRLTDQRVFFCDGNKRQPVSEFLMRVTYHYTFEWSVHRGAYQLSNSGEESSWLHWIIDGVVICSVRVPGNPLRTRLDLYLSAEGLRTDLSGFSIDERAPDSVARVSRAWDYAGGVTERLRSALGSHYSQGLFKAGGLLGSGAALTVFAGGPAFFAGCLLVGVIFSPAFAMGGIEIVRAANFGRILANDCRNELASLRARSLP